ncbi:MAG: transcription termination factor NusA [Candidatus Izemoplasmatales bacterium]|jgi:N utilization substance protein A|nr:transcription termination factor NusA [Candidatus Izemoplasmatales bacterium]MDD4355203.1 transcription termination factor NusA [Candidatus Izemoplasmatales bacterium]MDD4988237.1 transcription termination factor NusA [Candidatus Izemoplasmatales bacterium]MDY0373872.1 transcription termination factor NusA [Candidatus Izemoplasmatales bacterium]NLF48062.1 transcription termination/antitermination protein NusA [Acholeplasmataceae bacterium]
MISKEFFKALEQVAEDRGVSKDKILDIFGKGLLNAYKKDFNGQQNAKVVFNEEKAEILIVATYLVVDTIDPEAEKGTQITVEEAQELKKNARIGDIIEVKVTPKDFGRIAASSAKQILTQGLKQLERERNFEIFSEKVGEMVIAEVVAMNNEFVTLFLGYETETSIPAKDLLESDLVIGNHVRVYITKVEQTTKGPKVYVSRTDRNLVKRLMENAIPELQEGIVEIMGLARDPGDRCKVCVASNNPKVDPLGACLGRNGVRIKEVIDLLNGEKIDIYKWSDDPKELVSNAIQPAKSIAVIVDPKDKTAIAIVPDDQLSLAIGKKGQNARLAVQSSGWKIDIKSETDALVQDIHY